VRQKRRARRQKPDVDAGPAVPLPREGEDRVGAGLHLALDGPREVHPEEGERRVGDGVDQPAHEVAPLRPQEDVLAAEGDDAQLRSGTREARDAVGVQAGAGDQAPCAEGGVGGGQPQTAGLLRDADERRPERHLGAPRAQAGEQRARHPAVVDDRGVRRVDGAQAGGVGLDRPQFVGVDHPQARHAVGGAALQEPVEPRQLGLVGRDDHLADRLVRDAVLGAEVAQAAHARDAQARPQRAGRVVDAGVHDAAVVPRLVAGDVGPLLEQQQPEARVAREQGVGGGQADDAATHDGDVVEGAVVGARRGGRGRWHGGAYRGRGTFGPAGDRCRAPYFNHGWFNER